MAAWIIYMSSISWHPVDPWIWSWNQSHAGAEPTHNAAKFGLPPLCPVSMALEPADNNVLTVFVVEQAKSNSLASTIMESCNFNNTIQVNNSCRTKQMQAVPPPLTMPMDDIKQHILYCIATRSKTVGNLVGQPVVMKSMLTAENHAQFLAAARLLLQTQISEKSSSNN